MDIKSAWEQEIVLYIGTRKLVALLGRVQQGEPVILDHCELINPQGFENGLVKNLEAAAASIEEIINKLIPSRGSRSIYAQIVLGNAKLRTFSYSSSQYYEGFPRQINAGEVRSVIHQTKSVATLPLSEAILQVLPESFIVNDMTGIRNPLGLEAHRLGVNLKIFTMNFEDFKNLERAVEVADIEAKGFFPRTLTSSHAVLTEQEKEEGSLLVDIADDMTQFVVWKNGSLTNTRVFPEGGRFLTEMLASQWELEFHDAERLKERYATLEMNPDFGEELIPLVRRNGKETFHIRRAEFHEKFMCVGEAWLQRLFDDAKAFTLVEKLFKPHYVMTGGGTTMDGMIEFINEKFALEARIGHTRSVEASNELLVDASLAPAMGMMAWLATDLRDYERLVQPQGFFERTFASARDWFSAYF